ncbi:restriction endonuclease [Fodinicola feengrottensis]|uniref:restriction endonuclease n=1 Tax=Fodinicola feengrottensis TaxID=435914 RepID=UPI0036F2B856
MRTRELDDRAVTFVCARIAGTHTPAMLNAFPVVEIGATGKGLPELAERLSNLLSLDFQRLEPSAFESMIRQLLERRTSLRFVELPADQYGFDFAMRPTGPPERQATAQLVVEVKRCRHRVGPEVIRQFASMVASQTVPSRGSSGSWHRSTILSPVSSPTRVARRNGASGYSPARKLDRRAARPV